MTNNQEQSMHDARRYFDQWHNAHSDEDRRAVILMILDQSKEEAAYLAAAVLGAIAATGSLRSQMEASAFVRMLLSEVK